MALTNKEASIVLGMAARGDSEHDIASYFGVNQGRIAEIKRGDYGSIPTAPANELPPKGNYGTKGRRLRAYAGDALKVLLAKGPDGVTEAIRELEEGLRRFDAHEA
jgi:hypothetical protein